MRILTALVAGLLFGAGLLISGMSNPSNVLAFLDVAGQWQPALAFTMAAAIAVAAPAFALARRTRRSLLGGSIDLTDTSKLDFRLVLGSAIFGVGWGLSGICPGPGLLLLTRASPQAVLFGLGMALGMAAASRIGSMTATAGEALGRR